MVEAAREEVNILNDVMQKTIRSYGYMLMNLCVALAPIYNFVLYGRQGPSIRAVVKCCVTRTGLKESRYS